MVWWKLVLREETFRSVQFRGFWALCLTYMMSSAIRTFLPSRGRWQPKTMAITHTGFRVSWAFLTNVLKESFSRLVLGVFVRWSMALGNALPTIRKLSCLANASRGIKQCFSTLVCIVKPNSSKAELSSLTAMPCFHRDWLFSSDCGDFYFHVRPVFSVVKWISLLLLRDWGIQVQGTNLM